MAILPSEYLNRDLIRPQFEAAASILGAKSDLPGGEVYGNYKIMDIGSGGRRIVERSAGEIQEENFRRQRDLNREAARPSIEALEQSRPIVEQAYGQREQSIRGRIDPLKERYNTILQDLTNREQKETQQASTVLSREFGKRGVPLSSGIFDKSLMETTQPISQFYGVQRKETGLAQEDDLKYINDLISSLPIEKATELNKLQQQLAALESGAGQNAITQALSLTQMQQQQSQFDKQLDQALKIAQMQNQRQPEAQKLAFADVLGGGYVYNPYTGETVSTLRDLRGGAGGVSGGGGNYYQTPPPSNTNPTQNGRYRIVG